MPGPEIHAAKDGPGIAGAVQNVVVHAVGFGHVGFDGEDGEAHFGGEELHHAVLELEELAGAVGGLAEGDDAGISDQGLERLHVVEAAAGFGSAQWDGIVLDPSGGLIDGGAGDEGDVELEVADVVGEGAVVVAVVDGEDGGAVFDFRDEGTGGAVGIDEVAGLKADVACGDGAAAGGADARQSGIPTDDAAGVGDLSQRGSGAGKADGAALVGGQDDVIGGGAGGIDDGLVGGAEDSASRLAARTFQLRGGRQGEGKEESRQGEDDGGNRQRAHMD
ncbi:MAG: hypothetical protein JNK48_24605 [Bryobacterales bacterium]|nr:hypothetical protein [Bryobacterales bacterium]